MHAAEASAVAVGRCYVAGWGMAKFVTSITAAVWGTLSGVVAVHGLAVPAFGVYVEFGAFFFFSRRALQDILWYSPPICLRCPGW